MKNLFVLVFLIAVKIHAQVTIWLPDSTMTQYSEYSFPIGIEGILPADSIIAYDLSVAYDTTLIQFTGATSAGSITEDWGEPVVNDMDGLIRAAGFSAWPAVWDGEDAQVLLFIRFEVVKDTICDTELEIAQCLLYNLEGDMTVDSLRDATVEIIYNAVPVIAEIPSVQIDEDQSGFLQISDYVSDANNPLEELVLTIGTIDHIDLILDQSGWGVDIIPEANWYGVENIEIAVTDPYNITANESIIVNVRSVNDLPGAFQLSLPPHDTTFYSDPDIVQFEWSVSENVDPEDNITYVFYLSTDSLTLLDGAGSILTTQNSILYSGSLNNGTYYWGVKATDDAETVVCDEIFKFHFDVTGVAPYGGQIPDAYHLSPNYPNPFNPSTVLVYQLPEPGRVRIQVFDGLGRLVRTLLDGWKESGYHDVFWDGKDETGGLMASGVYFIRMTAGDFTGNRKIILMK